MPVTYASLDDLQTELNEAAALGVTPQYMAKQMHRIPALPVVDRAALLVNASRGKRVLHLGCGWPPSPLHELLAPISAHIIGVDIAAPPLTRDNIWQLDLDERPEGVPLRPYDVIIAGEVLEHLCNPGRLLCTLARLFPQVMLVISVPNAFSAVARQWLTHGIEEVNREHTAWYSYHTLKVLVERCGYTILDMCWYNGEPLTAEGLVCTAVPKGA